MKMYKRVLLTIAGLLIVLSALGAVKGLQIKRMAAHGDAYVPPPQTVTVAEVNRSDWETSIRAVGSLTAVKGVVVAAEIPGKINQIAFESGSRVKAGVLLVQQDISTETAQLRIAQSEVELALKDLGRSRKLKRQKVISTARLDELKAAHDQAVAQVSLFRAAIAKKTIRAPFDGRLGIRQVNIGAILDSGQPIVTLQSLDPIYVNFNLPQQNSAKLTSGLTVRIGNESLGGQTVEGTITAVNPEVDNRTRNIAVQATLQNIDERLRPGMYATVSVVLPTRQTVLTIPATAVHYAAYSNSVPGDRASRSIFAGLTM